MRAGRVLVLTADYPPDNWSGIGIAVAHQARALAKLGCDVRILMPFPPSAAREPPLYRLSQNQFPLDPRQGDIVHLHSLSLAELAIEFTRRFRLPFIYTAHSLLQLELQGKEPCCPWIAIQERVFRAANYVFFLSQVELESALRFAPFLSSRAGVLPNGLPEPPLHRARDKFGGPIVFAGRLTHNKGIDIAVSLFAKLLDCGCKNTFAIAGGHGSLYGERLAARFAKRQVHQSRFLGWLDPLGIEQLFSEAALVVMPSRYEPFGLVALEAMRLGTPVVGSSVGGLRKLLGPNSGGIAVDGFNIDAWFRSCRHVLEDESRWKQLSEQGPQYVMSRFSSDALARQFLSVVGRLDNEL
jgi:1,4-alpha-glucan branching enzyme